MIKFDELLPQESFAYLNTTGEIIMIKKGEKGYYPQPITVTLGRTVDDLNELLGVTPFQAEAMVNGSMWGWEVPATNPSLWEEKGIEKLTHNRLPEHIKKQQS